MTAQVLTQYQTGVVVEKVDAYSQKEIYDHTFISAADACENGPEVKADPGQD